jgi:hypothetical protein
MLRDVPSQGGGSAAPVGRLRSRLLDAPLRWLAIAAGAVALAVSGLFGGFHKTSQPLNVLPSVAPSVANVGSGVTITVSSVVVTDDIPPLKLANDGDRWVIVVATVEVTAKESLPVIDSVRIRGPEGIKKETADQVRLVSDASDVLNLNPNLPSRLGYFWEQDGKAPAPTKVDVGLFGQSFIHQQNDNHYTAWVADASPRAHVLMTPQDRRSAAAK